MSKTSTRLAGAAAFAAVLLISSAAGAAVLYDNPSSGFALGNTSIGAFADPPNYAGDSFTLSATGVVTGVNFASWNNPDDHIQTVQWAVLDGKADTGALLAAGQAVVTPTFFAHNFYDILIDFNAFTIPDLTLGAGTYWLYLHDAVTDNLLPVTWDQTIGASQFDNNTGETLGNTFQILGHAPGRVVPGGGGCNVDHPLACVGDPNGGVPEPATWALLIMGFGGIGAVLRHRRCSGAFAA